MYTHYDLFKHVLYVQFSNYCDQVILEDQSFLALNGIDYKIYEGKLRKNRIVAISSLLSTFGK